MEPYDLPVWEEADIRGEDNVAFINVPGPAFSEGDSAPIVHDCHRLLTAYLDRQIQKCYVINLNTSVAPPPRSPLDLFMKLTPVIGRSVSADYRLWEEIRPGQCAAIGGGGV